MKKIKINLKKKKSTTNESTNKKTKLTKRQIFDRVMLVFVVTSLLVGTGGLIFAKIIIDKVPPITMDLFESPESSKIYAADGTVIANLGLESRENISYNDIPQVVIDAFVSIEDSRFFEHNGFDLPRFTKSLIVNIKDMAFSQGGSTLTMQLVKLSLKTTEKSIPRKIQDIYGAIKLETITNKKRIFELYVNMINFGASTNRGIENSSLYYFGKSASELNLSEAALLAGVINRPTYYSPFKNLENATKRRNTVLDLMQYHGYITKEEASLAKSIKVEDMLTGGAGTHNNEPYLGYINTVVEEVMELTGEDPYQTPMDIYTFMDVEVQKTIEAIQNGETDVQFPDDLMQTSIVAMDNQTGQIIGIGGGRNDIVSKGLNRATTMTKQPGSAVKPFLSYALAFEYLGWATDHVVTDKPVNYRGTTKVLQNFDRTYRGEVRLPEAVGLSLNTPAYITLEQVADKIGAKGIIQYLNSLGLERVSADNFDLGYAIGGSKFEVTPIEMAGAHATMINGGVYIQPHTVNKIEFKDGSEPYIVNITPVKALSPEAAYMVAVLEEQNVSVNYGNYMQLLKRDYPIYGKTGTTDYGDTGVEYGIPVGAAKDKWMIASSSQYTSAVWVGYDQAVKDKKTYFDSSKSKLNLPGKINKLVLDAIHKGKEKPKGVTRPSGVTDITHVLGVFPYAAPIDNMNPELITTGLIKKENASLQTLNAPGLSQISSFTASGAPSANKLNLLFNWGSYPDSSQMGATDGTVDLSITVGGKYYPATGKLLFHPSWIFGSIKYKAKVLVDDVVVKEITSDNSQASDSIDLPIGGKKVKVCGYYSRENGGGSSNEICSDIDIGNFDVEVPATGSTYEVVNKFVKDYNLTNWSFAENTNDFKLADINKVTSIVLGGTNIAGTKQKLSSLNGTTVVSYNKDKQITLPTYSTNAMNELTSKYGVTVKKSGEGTEFSHYLVSGTQQQVGANVMLSQMTDFTVVMKSNVVAPTSITISQNPSTSAGQTSIVLTCTVNGGSNLGNIVYQWFKGGVIVGNSNTLTVDSADFANSFSVTVSYTGGTKNSDPYIIQ